MFRSKITTVAFTERPAMSSLSKHAGELDVLIKTSSNLHSNGRAICSDDQYCLALLEKICTIPGEQLKQFIVFQLSLLAQPSEWLIALDQLIIKNAHLFESKSQMLKAEKILIIAELAFQTLKPDNNAGYVVFNFERVKATLKKMSSIEEQLIYLYKLKAEYLQSNPPPLNPNEISFDQKVMIEIKTITELQEVLINLKSKRPAKNRLADTYIDNEDFLSMMKISKRTAQTWRDTGIIAYTHIRYKIYYLLSDVEALLQSNYIRSLKKRE